MAPHRADRRPRPPVPGGRHPWTGGLPRRAGPRCQTRPMELPQHWTTVDGFSPHLGEHGGTLTVWGWSTESEADAARVARERLAEALARIAVEGRLPPGRGYYPRMPLREPVLEEVEAGVGRPARRRHPQPDGLRGALHRPALHRRRRRPRARGRHRTASRLRARVGDRDRPRGAPRRGRRGLLPPAPLRGPRPTPMAPADEPDADAADADVASPRPGDTSVAESLACEPVWEFARRHPDLGVRVYRTAAGLRVLVTGASAPPASDRARALLTELGSDPLYVELCSTHDSYRARLTPSRSGSTTGRSRCRGRSPTSGEGGAEEWVAEYDARAAGFAVCRLISASGPVPGPDEQRLVVLHDSRCRVGERLPLTPASGGWGTRGCPGSFLTRRPRHAERGPAWHAPPPPTTTAPLSRGRCRWRRMGDLNPRGFYPNTISNRAH